MADPFIGEIRAVAFKYAPEGWLPCDGRSLSVQQFQALYALLGNTYGGNTSAFNLPDLRGRGILGAGAGTNLPPIVQGTLYGQAALQLTTSQLPPHTHTAAVNDPGHSHSAAMPPHTHPFTIPCDNTGGPTSPTPGGNVLSTGAGVDAGFTNVVNQINGAGIGLTLNPVPATNLYAATATAVSPNYNTGNPSATAASATGISQTGVSVQIGTTGSGSAVSTQSPVQGLLYIIATTGIWPPQPD